MLALEVIVRGSSNFIGFPDICSKALLDAGFVVMLFLVLHLLGGLLAIGSRSVHFAASLFYYRISRGPKGSNTSTSLISSNSVHRLGVRALKLGAVEFLTKPFRDQDLLDAIQQALERDRIAQKEQAEVHDLQERYRGLTTREREVMTLVVSGM